MHKDSDELISSNDSSDVPNEKENALDRILDRLHSLGEPPSVEQIARYRKVGTFGTMRVAEEKKKKKRK